MLEEVINSARRRFILNDAIAQLVLSAAIGAGGISLLLIVGTRFLEWWIVAAITLGAAIFGVFRLYRRAPAKYAAAVALDERAQLQDSLSTALHFRAGSASISGGLREAQRQQAEERARQVDVGSAIPLVIPATAYALAGLAMLAGSLAGIRY